MKPIYYKDTFMRISQEKRDTILQAAIVEFAEHGYESANINRIALSAAISVGSLYKYFGCKEDLFLTIIQHGVESLKTVLEEIVRSEEELLSRIEKIIRVIQSYSRANVHITKLYSEVATVSRSELVWRLVSDMESMSAGLYTSLIQEAIDQGVVRNDMHPPLFAFFLDNLFMMLQFSYACDYYKERLKLYVGEDVFVQDDLVAEQLMKFIRGAFK